MPDAAACRFGIDQLTSPAPVPTACPLHPLLYDWGVRQTATRNWFCASLSALVPRLPPAFFPHAHCPLLVSSPSAQAALDLLVDLLAIFVRVLLHLLKSQAAKEERRRRDERNKQRRD